MMYENWAKIQKKFAGTFPFNLVTDMEIYKEKVHKWADNYESDTYFHWVIEWKENHDLIGTMVIWGMLKNHVLCQIHAICCHSIGDAYNDGSASSFRTKIFRLN